MADFNFIAIPELRECLDSDYREIHACLKAGAWKAVHVLAGSLIEALLIDALYAEKSVDHSKLDSLELSELVALCKKTGVLSDETVDLTTVVRKYRNLIHPGRLKRLEKHVEKSGAVVASELVEIIVKAVAKRKKSTYGYTAEQLFARLRGGTSALPLVSHLVDSSQPCEIERLLIEIIPKAYLYSPENQEATPKNMEHLRACYRKTFDASPQETKRKIAKNVYGVFRGQDEYTVLAYEEAFFRGSDLQFLDPDEQRFVKAHLLPRASDQESLGRLLDALTGIGPYLDPPEAEDLLTNLAIAVMNDNRTFASRAKMRLYKEYDLVNDEGRAKVREAIDGVKELTDVLAHLQQREAKLLGNAVRNVSP
ncbi:MAG TPA: hypothetical protein VKU19_16420 [Bryobacteraceae bacterium]|nr:hypothetical protein [Bryobacteraceae bacterium]